MNHAGVQMRLMEHVRKRWLDGNARFWGKQCARVMLSAYRLKKEQYESTAPNRAWLAVQGILQRTDWVRVGETTVLHQGSGQEVDISEDIKIIYAIHAVIECEYGYEIDKLLRLPPWERGDMLREAHVAADKFIAELTS
jgi:hypothetical protein